MISRFISWAVGTINISEIRPLEKRKETKKSTIGFDITNRNREYFSIIWSVDACITKQSKIRMCIILFFLKIKKKNIYKNLNIYFCDWWKNYWKIDIMKDWIKVLYRTVRIPDRKKNIELGYFFARVKFRRKILKSGKVLKSFRKMHYGTFNNIIFNLYYPISLERCRNRISCTFWFIPILSGNILLRLFSSWTIGWRLNRCKIIFITIYGLYLMNFFLTIILFWWMD